MKYSPNPISVKTVLSEFPSEYRQGIIAEGMINFLKFSNVGNYTFEDLLDGLFLTEKEKYKEALFFRKMLHEEEGHMNKYVYKTQLKKISEYIMSF